MWVVDGLTNAVRMFWEVWWALVLGFVLSGIVQAWVPRERVEGALSGHGLAPAAPLRHCPHLTFAQRDQRDLRCHEARFEQDQRQHDGDVEQR